MEKRPENFSLVGSWTPPQPSQKKKGKRKYAGKKNKQTNKQNKQQQQQQQQNLMGRDKDNLIKGKRKRGKKKSEKNLFSTSYQCLAMSWEAGDPYM